MGIIWLYSIAPLVSFWSIFVARTGQLYPKQNARREAKALTPPPSMAEKAQAELKAVGMELAIPEEPQKVYETFDHPAPPIAVLGAALPSAPTGFGWEISTVTNDEGNPAMRLVLLNLSTVTEVGSIEGDLHVVKRWKYAPDDTYPMLYRRAEKIAKGEVTGYKSFPGGITGWSSVREPVYNDDPTKMLGKVMMANLITPMVDWARLITLRYIVEHPDEAKCNYMLIESEPEKVFA